MKKIINILKNKEIMGRIVFTIMILFIFRLGAQVTVPGVTIPSDSQLNKMAELSNGKVFDGTTSLIDAFTEVRGYN